MTAERLSNSRRPAQISSPKGRTTCHKPKLSEARRELRAIVDARLWFVETVSKDYDAELDSLDEQLDCLTGSLASRPPGAITHKVDDADVSFPLTNGT